MCKEAKIELPDNRIIRKRIAARTIGIHFIALPPEMQALINIAQGAYLSKHDLPDKIQLGLPDGDSILLSKDDAWKFADAAGARVEWEALPDTLSGKAIGLFSTAGQGAYADYGRPTIDFASYTHDYIGITLQQSNGTIASQGLSQVMLGPMVIVLETMGAAGLTAVGHSARGAQLTSKTVLADVVSTGVFEGSTAWASAKLGVFTGFKALRLAAMLPVPGVHLAALPIGLLVGATVTIFAKHLANQCKNIAIDSIHQPSKSTTRMVMFSKAT